jgi:hypothetical protein
MIKTITITSGQEIIVDEQDYERVNRYSWFYHRQPNGYGNVCRGKSVRKPSGKWGTTSIPIGQEILGKMDGLTVDHKNRNPLDNRRANLRFATRQQNSRNRIKRNRLGIPGVTREGPRFLAGISLDKNKKVRLGVFDTAEEAGAVYRQANLKHFGEFSPFYDHGI